MIARLEDLDLPTAAPVEWREWRCGHCGAYITDYDATAQVHLRRRCQKCKTRNELDRRVRHTAMVHIDPLDNHK